MTEGTLKNIVDAIRDWCVNKFALISSVPTKTSDLNNDSGFLTSHQQLKTINS